MNEPSPLPDDLREYLDAAREPEPTPHETRERMFARLLPLLPPIGGGGPGGDGPGHDPSSGHGPSGGHGPSTGHGPSGGGVPTAGIASTATGFLKGKLLVAGVAATLGAVGGAGLHATLAPPRTVVVSAPAVASVAPAPAGPAPVLSVVVPSAELPAPSVSVEVAPPPPSAAESTGPRPSTMRAERVLLEAANAALIRGDAAAAITSLQTHKQRYPRGELAQERDILMAQAQKLKASGQGASPR